MNEKTTFVIQGPPPAVGAWVLGGDPGLYFHMRVRPRWLTRWVCHWLMEWRWEDFDNKGA